MADRVIGSISVLMMSILTNRVFQLGNRHGLPIFEVNIFQLLAVKYLALAY